MMKITQMQAFNEVMLTGSVSQSARNLNRSQPSVSALIAGLEKSLGMKLFEREGGRLVAVPEAQYLHQECVELLKRMGTVSQNMRRLKALQSGELNIACMPGPSVFFLPTLLAEFSQRHEAVRSTLVSRSSDAVFQLLASQQYDVGIADHDAGSENDSRLFDIEQFNYPCLVAVHSSDPLCKHKRITPEELHDRPLATLYAEHAIHQRLASAFREHGCRMNVKFAAQQFVSLLMYVEKRVACAIVDPLTATSYQILQASESNVRFVPFEPTVQFDVALVKPAHRPTSLVARAFIEYLSEQLRKPMDNRHFL